MVKSLSKFFAYLRHMKQKCAKKNRNENLHVVYSTQYNITLVRIKSKVNIWKLCLQNCQPKLKKNLYIIYYLLCKSFHPFITHTDLQIKIM